MRLAILAHKPKTVLDVGSGHGYIVRKMLNRKIDAIGIDISKYAGEMVAKNKTIIGEAKVLPFKDKSFDIVCSKEFFEHIPDEEIDQVYSEMQRVGEHVIALICYKTKPAEGHVSVHPKEWWEKRLPGCELL